MKTERALVAVGANGTMVVLACDGEAMWWDLENISDNGGDIGLPDPAEYPGIFVFHGEAHLVSYGDEPPENDWHGTYTVATPEEIDAITRDYHELSEKIEQRLRGNFTKGETDGKSDEKSGAL